MPNYDTAPKEIIALINETTNEFHPELVEAGVTIEAVMAFDDKGGYPVKANGYPALACIRANSLKNRVKGFADAEITIDKSAYDALNDQQKKALIDHELFHLVVVRDKEGNIKHDDAERPKIKLKKHDYQFGWFREIALRHGENSPEVYQANLLWKNDGPTFFTRAQ